MEQDELLLGINEWLDLHGIDRAYRKDMKKTYETLKPDLEAQLAKDNLRFLDWLEKNSSREQVLLFEREYKEPQEEFGCH